LLKDILKRSKYIMYIVNELYGLYENFIVKYPNTKFGFWMRKKYWASKCKIGKNAFLCQGTIIHASKNELIEIGDNIELGNDVVLNIGQCKGIYIGNEVAIAIGTFIRSGNHKFDRIDIPIKEQGHDCRILNFNNREYSIIIEDDVWIGAHCTLLSGTHLGKGTIVSAGSVVSTVVPPYSIVVGNPARVMGNRLKKVKKND